MENDVQLRIHAPVLRLSLSTYSGAYTCLPIPEKAFPFHLVTANSCTVALSVWPQCFVGAAMPFATLACNSGSINILSRCGPHFHWFFSQWTGKFDPFMIWIFM